MLSYAQEWRIELALLKACLFHNVTAALFHPMIDLEQAWATFGEAKSVVGLLASNNLISPVQC